jgi:N-acetylated-alpha-linked acidic dipeptidase
MREETKVMNQLIESGMVKDVSDPTQTFIVPKVKSAVPALNFTQLRDAITKLNDAAKAVQTSLKNASIPASKQNELDAMLIQTERLLTRSQGLPRRDWFRHQIYAPGFYTGYGVKTLPGIREAIEQRDWKEAEEQIAIAAKTLDGFSEQLIKIKIALEK